MDLDCQGYRVERLARASESHHVRVHFGDVALEGRSRHSVAEAVDSVLALVERCGSPRAAASTAQCGKN